MTSFGYTLSAEEHDPRDLVRHARQAEEVGFDFVSMSDHYHPWVSAQGHSPFVWSVLGAIAGCTERVGVGVGVTCPILRIHPAILAQATATTSLLAEGRFFFGVGTGEALNKAVELAARIGDGYWGHPPDREIVEQFEAGGGRGPRYSQLNVCWAEDPAAARKTVHEVWPNAGTGQLSQDLPTWTHFEEAAAMVSEDEATKSLACGPDPEPFLESVRTYVDAGYDHLYFHQIGPDQDGFFRFWTDTLRPALADVTQER